MPEERILLDGHGQIGQRLVSTDVQGAQRDAAATQGVGDGEIFRDLFLDVGGPIAVEEQEFGTDQAGTVRSFSSRRAGVRGRAEVGGDLDPRTVNGDRRVRPRRRGVCFLARPFRLLADDSRPASRPAGR